MKVVTLPPFGDPARALTFALDARRGGGNVLEVRNDLWSDALRLEPLAAVLPVLISERGRRLSPQWCATAQLADVELGCAPAEGPRALVSLHAEQPLTTPEALSRWSTAPLPEGALIKHVEPLGDPATGSRLLDTQRALAERFGAERVTVLATGPFALPFRAVLAARNALDYVALDARFFAAPGQRLLADAVRADRAPAGTLRLGILGTGIGGSRSPRIHPPPFDRIDLPEDAEPGPLVAALTPYYRGFAVTRPFKRKVAAWLGSGDEAVNTLFLRDGAWHGANTDVDGARAALEALGGAEVTVLGGGGVAPALRAAAERTGQRVRMLRRADAEGSAISGSAVWTWPPELPPPTVSLRGARVAVIAYGAAGRVISEQIRSRGGEPLALGARWLIRQARAQRALWMGDDTSTSA